MNLIYVSAVDSSEISGQGSFERNFLDFLLTSGERRFKRVFIISPNYTRGNSDSIPSIKRKGKGFKAQFFYHWQATRQLIKILRSHNKGTRVFIRESGIMILPLLVSKIYGVKVITRSGPGHGNLKDYNHTQNPLILWLYKMYLRMFYLFVDRVTVVTEGIKKTLIANYKIDPSEIVVIPNPANDALFSQVLTETTIKDESVYNFGYIGSISEHQRVQDVLDALKILDEAGSINVAQIKVWIVGGGSYLDQLKARVEELGLGQYVVLTGKVDQQELKNYYNKIDCAIATYSHRFNNIKGSSALKVVEYLFNQKYVLAADIDDYRYLEEKGFGQLYKIENPESLASEILNISIEKKAQSKNAKEFVMTERSSETIFNRYLDEIIKA